MTLDSGGHLVEGVPHEEQFRLLILPDSGSAGSQRGNGHKALTLDPTPLFTVSRSHTKIRALVGRTSVTLKPWRLHCEPKRPITRTITLVQAVLNLQLTNRGEVGKGLVSDIEGCQRLPPTRRRRDRVRRRRYPKTRLAPEALLPTGCTDPRARLSNEALTWHGMNGKN